MEQDWFALLAHGTHGHSEAISLDFYSHNARVAMFWRMKSNQPNKFVDDLTLATHLIGYDDGSDVRVIPPRCGEPLKDGLEHYLSSVEVYLKEKSDRKKKRESFHYKLRELSCSILLLVRSAIAEAKTAVTGWWSK